MTANDLTSCSVPLAERHTQSTTTAPSGQPSPIGASGWPGWSSSHLAAPRASRRRRWSGSSVSRSSLPNTARMAASPNPSSANQAYSSRSWSSCSADQLPGRWVVRAGSRRAGSPASTNPNAGPVESRHPSRGGTPPRTAAGPVLGGADRASFDLGWQVTARQLLRRLLDVGQHGIRMTVPASVDDKARHLALGPPLDDKDAHVLALINRMRRHGGTNDSPAADAGQQARLAGVEPDAIPAMRAARWRPASYAWSQPAAGGTTTPLSGWFPSRSYSVRWCPSAISRQPATTGRPTVPGSPSSSVQPCSSKPHTKRSRGFPPAVDSE